MTLFAGSCFVLAPPAMGQTGPTARTSAPPRTGPASAEAPADGSAPVSPRRSKVELQFAYPGARLSMGPLFPLASARAPVFFCLDATLTGMLALGKSMTSDGAASATLVLLPELGYTYETTTAHLGHLGFGVGYRGQVLGVHYVPRFVVGSREKTLAVGFRQDVMVEILTGVIVVGLAHQALWTSRRPTHDLRLLAAADLGRLLYVILKASRK